jgi:hypothetical protein
VTDFSSYGSVFAAAKGVYEFAFIVEPLKIQGGTGSTVAPVAVR